MATAVTSTSPTSPSATSPQPDGMQAVDLKLRKTATWRSLERVFSSLKLGGAVSSEECPNIQPPPPYSETEQTFSAPAQHSPLQTRSSSATPDAEMPSFPPVPGALAVDRMENLTSSDNCSEAAELVDSAIAFLPSEAEVPEDLPRLPKPVIIPRLNPGTTFPFGRAWAPELERHAITQRDWLAILDNLNIMTRPHPSITAVQIAAFGVGFAPIDGADGIAAGLEAAASAIAQGVAKVRCDGFLAKVNKAYLHPRRLHAHIARSKRLKRSLGLDPKDPLVSPLSESTLSMTSQQRCMDHLKDHACALEWDVPEPCPQTNALARLAAWRVRHKIASMDRKARWHRKRAWKRHLKGKPLKREGREERWRAKMVGWLMVQNLDDFEREEKEIEQEKAAKKARRKLIGAHGNRDVR